MLPSYMNTFGNTTEKHMINNRQRKQLAFVYLIFCLLPLLPLLSPESLGMLRINLATCSNHSDVLQVYSK